MLGPNPKVIVADDERIVADTLVMILRNSGFDARAAYSGATAVELARDFQPDILITDVVMPKMTGIDAAIQVRSMLPSCKVLLFSGLAETTSPLEKTRIEGYEFDVLTKPVHPRELLAKLKNDLPNI